MDANGVDCAAIPARTTDCDVEVTYMYNLQNVGGVSMDITEVQRTRGDSTVDLIREVDPKFLLVGEFTKVTETEVVDFCVDNTFTTTVTAKADPPAGVPCEGTDMYKFTIDPPQTAPPISPTTPPPTPLPPIAPTAVVMTPAPTPAPVTPAPVTPAPTLTPPSCLVDVSIPCCN